MCPACDAPQPLAPGTDLFAVLGLARNLSIDAEDLERRYHGASRIVHPDRHQTAEPRARATALELAAEVNRAYRTLRDPVARGRYWLDLHGRPLGQDNNRIPSGLAALVFETQEKLEDLRGDPSVRAAVEAVRDELTGRVDGLENALRARYREWSDGQAESEAALAELRGRLSELAYLHTLLEDVEAALGD